MSLSPGSLDKYTHFPGKKRGISVASPVMQFEVKDHVVNLLDIQSIRISEEPYRALAASLDSALMVIDAARVQRTEDGGQ